VRNVDTDALIYSLEFRRKTTAFIPPTVKDRIKISACQATMDRDPKVHRLSIALNIEGSA